MLVEILLLLTAFPVGFLIAFLANDELVSGRKWFMAIIVLSLISSALFALTKYYVFSWTFLFIFVVTFVSLVKSYDKLWTKRRA